MSQSLVLIIPSKKAGRAASRLPARVLDPVLLVEDFAKFQANTKADNTRKSYDTQWRQFEEWCQVNGFVAEPSSVPTLSAYVGQLYRDGKSLSTLNVALAAIRSRHITGHLEDPMAASSFKEFMSGVRRTMAKDGLSKREVARTINLDQLRALAEACGDDLEGQRNRALILVGFGGWFRRSELLSIQYEQLKIERGRILVRLDRSKTNQTGQRIEKIELTEIIGSYADVCPYSAMQQWLSASGITAGPVFRKIYQGMVTESALTSGSWFWPLLDNLGTKAGIPFHIAPHRTLRASPITLAVLSGQPMLAVMKRARHKSAETTTRYFDEAAAGQAEVNRAVYRGQ